MDPLSSLVVGEEGCNLNDVVNVFFNEVNSDAVFESWTNFARELRIESYKIKVWRQDKLLNKLTLKDILHEILESWKTEKGKDATLPNLLKHLENVNLKNVVDDLKKLFSTENQVQNVEQLFKPTLPTGPNYYIPRILVARRVIDMKVFSTTHKDVFVVDGINRHRLSQLAKKELTDTSTNQVRNEELSVRFILLEHFGDWALLCGKTTNPIHLMRHHEGKFQWICTNGDISALQRESDEKNQIELDEEKFIEEIETDLQFQPNQPICISDSPGMGKSLLLASIGRQLHQRYEQRCIAFIVISEFMVKIRDLLPNFSSTEKAVVEALLQMCENTSARQQLIQKITTPIQSPSTQIELMFDGFDEVSTENFDLARECLDTLKTYFKSGIRIWVTTRPQHLHEIEKRFSVLGYSIQAFQEKHQINFLTSFWNSQVVKLDGNRLQSFSKTCLKTLKKKLTKKDEDIAGIPLQCMMIAEVYMEDAIRFCDSKNKRLYNFTEATPSCIDINSIADLYEKMITHKIGKFIKTYPLVPENINRILPWHMYLALELIFPSHVHIFKDILKIECGLNPDYLVNIGILECRGSATKDSTRFIHRTFAEFLAARFFVVYVLLNDTADLQNVSREFHNFYFEQVLECFVKGGWSSTTYYECSFKHSVLCHFLNALLGSQTQISTGSCISLKSTNFLKDVFYACIHSGFLNIIRFLNLKYPESFKNILYLDSEILIDATTIAPLNLLKFLLERFEHEPLTEIQGKLHNIPTALHAAVRRGSYTIFEYILKEHHFEGLVKNGGKFLNLLYETIRETALHDLGEIKDRIQIVTVLCELNCEMLNYCDEHNNQTPVLAYMVNIKLLKQLIECGANLFHLDNLKNTILHKATEYLSSTDYYDLLQSIPKISLKSLLQMQNGDGEPTLHSIVKNGLATQDILDVILSNGIDINTSDEDGKTCIFDAIEMYNDDMRIATVKLLLENGADHTRVNLYGDSVLHYSAEKRRIDCLRFFLEEKNMDVNQINEDGDTPIFHALNNPYSNLETVEFLLERGADYKIINKNRENLLHYAASKRQLNCLELFLSLGGLDINLADDYGNTPLFCALPLYHDENTGEMITLLLGKGADYTISNKNANNVLHRLAAIGNNAECFSQFFGLSSLDVSARNCDNDTPLHLLIKNIAIYYYHRDDYNSFLHIIEALVSLGADLNAKNDDGKTPLDIFKQQILVVQNEVLMRKNLTIRRILKGKVRENHSQ